MNKYLHLLRGRMLLFLFWVLALPLSAQHVGLRTNALYWATTTPNAGLDVRLSQKWSFSLQAGYNPFEFGTKTLADGATMPRKLKHWTVMPEVKYWFCQSFERHYIGLHGLVGAYNVGGMLLDDWSSHRYRGEAYGVGLSWGYQWALGKHWGLEASLGAGYVYLPYDKYECVSCGDLLGKYRRNYFGPTKAELSFVYYFN